MLSRQLDVENLNVPSMRLHIHVHTLIDKPTLLWATVASNNVPSVQHRIISEATLLFATVACNNVASCQFNPLQITLYLPVLAYSMKAYRQAVCFYYSLFEVGVDKCLFNS